MMHSGLYERAEEAGVEFYWCELETTITERATKYEIVYKLIDKIDGTTIITAGWNFTVAPGSEKSCWIKTTRLLECECDPRDFLGFQKHIAEVFAKACKRKDYFRDKKFN